jgi:uncharacterized membrane protein
MIGFTDKHRATEVLSQLQRLKFDWTSNIRNGVVVEVESDGRLRMMQSHLLDPSARDDFRWEGLLTAIVPLPHVPRSSDAGKEFNAINAKSQAWLKNLSFDQGFLRDAAALLRPGNSAILSTIDNWQPAVEFLAGYSYFVLHTSIIRPPA